MDETKTALQAFISSIITIIVAVLSYSAVTDITAKPEPEVKVCQPDNTYELFQQKLAASVAKPKPAIVAPEPSVVNPAGSVVT
jgi:type II secretory pathway component PulC